MGNPVKVPDSSPNRDSVLGSKIHIISLGDAVEIEEFVILLQNPVNAQVVGWPVSWFRGGLVGRFRYRSLFFLFSRPC